MISIIALPTTVNVIGRLGENEHRQVLFDITEYLSEYPDATFTLLYMLPGANAAYPSTKFQYIICSILECENQIEYNFSIISA